MPGEQVSIAFQSGAVSIGPPGWPYESAAGNPTYLANNDPDRNGAGNVFPSYFMSPAGYPIYASELVGTFADASGDIVGTPFPVGLSATEVMPMGSYQLQLGVNDTIYRDNAGSWLVQVSSVPEPSCIGLFGCSLLLLRRRQQVHLEIKPANHGYFSTR
jgi:hypothetical protein